LAVIGFEVIGDPVREGAGLFRAGVFGVSDGSLDVFGWCSELIADLIGERVVGGVWVCQPFGY
jgi:hypothetical protein